MGRIVALVGAYIEMNRQARLQVRELESELSESERYWSNHSVEDYHRFLRSNMSLNEWRAEVGD